ncbi:MAG: phospholipase, partial [Alteraurantiacibacter sp.]
MTKIEKRVEDFDDTSVEPGVWRYAHARRVRVVIDGADYFDLIQQAMLKARQRILLIGWDFDTRI